MTANKTAATPENGKEKKPRGRKPGAKRAKSQSTTGAQARSIQKEIAPDPEDQAYTTISGALRNLVDNEARVRVMRHTGERYGLIVSVQQATGNTEQRSMAAGA